MVESKTCSKCGEEKPLSDFEKGRRQCKACRKIYTKELNLRNKEKDKIRKSNYNKNYWSKNKEKLSAQHKEWIEKNKEHHINYHINYRESNRDRINEACRIYYHANKESCNKKSKEYHKTHRELINKNQRSYDSARLGKDPNYKLARVLRDRIRKALKRDNAIKCESSAELLGCSIEFAKKHIEAQFKDGMTWANHGEWHIDHIRPCASFDLTDPEQQKQCFHFTNLQPLWAEDNIKKSDKIA